MDTIAARPNRTNSPVRNLLKTRKQVTLRIPLDGQAPETVRLFRFGLNETTKGTFLFDVKSAESVMQADRDYGNERSADYEHQALYDPPIEAPASAWYRLELREDGLYAVDLQWTDRARRMIEAREYRYISPAFMFNPEDGRIMEFINFALTNLPATKSMEALLKADPLVEFVANNYDTLVDNGLIKDKATESHREAVEGLRKASKRYVEAFGSGDESPNVEETAVESEIGSDSLQGASSNQKPQDPNNEEDKKLMEDAVKTMLAALGLSEEATPAEITEAFKSLRAPTTQVKAEAKQDALEPIREALNITDGDNLTVARSVVALRQENSDLKTKVTKLTKDLKELRNQAEEHTVDMLLSAARDEGKLYEGTEELYLRVLRDENGGIDVDRLRTLLEGLPPLAKLSAPSKEAARNEAKWAGKKWADLTPMDKLRLYESDPDLYTTLKGQRE